MKTLLMAFLLLLGGCDFDEEFEDSDNFQTEPVNRSYEASLASTDANVPGITGTSKIDIEGEVVRVQVNLQGVPQNITQIHYAYIAVDCAALQLALPNDINGTRSVNLSEDSTLTALKNDVAASGAAVATEDSSLENKSFVVKAFSALSGLPNEVGTNSLTIACGPINLTGSDDVEVVGPPDSGEAVGAATVEI